MVSTAPLGSAAFFTPALISLKNASNNLADSTAKLASGNRIIQVSDDVAGFSIASGLQSQLTGLKQASTNAAQATSMLQIASGALSEINEILNNAKSLAIQANSSSLTDSDRAFLQQQLETYLDSIDDIAGSTSFNGIKLLDGSLGGGNDVAEVSSQSTQATAIITLTANPSAGQTIKINGVTLTANTDFSIGGSASATATNLASALNASTNTALSQATYTANGASVTITARSGGTLGAKFFIDQATSTASFTTSGASTGVTDIYTLNGGVDNGLGVHSTKATGTIGDTLVNTQSQVAASVTLTLTGAAANNETLQIDNGNGGLITFTFKTTASANTDIQIGSDTQETLENTIETIKGYTGGLDYGLDQLEYRITNSSLVISNRTVGNPTDLSGAALDIAETVTNGSLSAASFSNGATTGVNVSGVNNASFIGTISGFTATYNSADNITARITIGDSTYTSTITDTTPAANSTARFTSTSGGYFDVQLSGGNGSAVTNQSQANDYADRLDAAFSTLTFYQERPVTSFTSAGSFVGASVKIQLGSFPDIRLNKIEVSAPASSGTDGTIDLTVNGTIFRASSGISDSIGAYETVKFSSLEDSNEFITLVNGATTLDFSTENAAATLEDNLRTAFNLDDEGTGVDFRVGNASDDTISVTLNSADSDSLFGGVTPDISTQADAAAAEDAIDDAIDVLRERIVEVGAAQSRFDSASANLSQSIQGITAAHSALADTDIAEESTRFAVETLKVNAAIAIIAQATSLQSGLLSVLQATGNR